MSLLRKERKAERSVKEGRIIRLSLENSRISVYVFLGKNKDYLMYQNYCSCPYFAFKSLYTEKDLGGCYHLLALNKALERDVVFTIYVSEDVFKDIIFEIYTMEKSFILRKLIMRRGY